MGEKGSLSRGMADYGSLSALREVARLVASRTFRKASRDFFFVGVGGWDMHTNVNPGLTRRFAGVNQGLTSFVDEMKAQGMWNNVVIASMSDFARTLDPNANLGSDHAWAANHFIASGSIKGGQIFNEFP